MADALVSPAVALGAGVVTVAAIAVSASKVKHIQRDDIVALMGVLGAFVFAAQMVNFTIPATGSSGHVIGGILLSAVLGPWAAFITLCSVLVIQCLVFADGGLLALGCNILNMAVMSCLVAYPLIFRPLAGNLTRPWRVAAASLAASLVALEAGALTVTLETELSGITSLPLTTFLAFMLPIHLAIGAVEGLATAAVLCFLVKYRPETLWHPRCYNANITAPLDVPSSSSSRNLKVIWGFLAATALLAGTFSWIASEHPDGLEWSIEKTSGLTDLPSVVAPTAFMPDYESGLSGIVGAAIVVVMLWAVTTLLFHRFRPASHKR